MSQRRSQRMVTEIVGVVILSLMFPAVGVVTSVGSAGGSSNSNRTNSWTVYHGSVDGSGVSASLKAVNTSIRRWTSPVLSGQLYGEPLVFSTDIFVATENNVVYALSAANGSVVWSRHLANAVPSSLLPCGNISNSIGITGTPVVDPVRHEIFAVADVLVNGRPEHRLFGLSTSSGKIELSQSVDPPRSDPAALLQRSGLTLDAGEVVFAMGGNYGDCGSYRGRVVAVKEAGSKPRFFTVDNRMGDSQGAIWMGGAAPVVDTKGSILVSVGNGSVYASDQPYDNSDSVLNLSPTLRLRQYFAPTSWAEDNARDFDLSTAPSLLSDGEIVVAGKSRTVYLLKGTHLGGIGGQQASLTSACSNDIAGGSAVVGTTVYLPCLSGTVAIRVTSNPPTLKLLWSSVVGGGPPVVAAGLVWTIGSNGELYGLNPSNGAVRQETSIGTSTNHFPTPSVGDGLLLVPTSSRVIAFNATPMS